MNLFRQASAFTRPLRALATAALAAPLLFGCTVSNAPDGSVTEVPSNQGAFVVRWSIEGGYDPASCDAHAVVNVRIEVFDSKGNSIATRFVDCRAFTARIDLDPGPYAARLQMVDSGNNARSDRLSVPTFNVTAGATATLDVDFPKDSFL